MDNIPTSPTGSRKSCLNNGIILSPEENQLLELRKASSKSSTPQSTDRTRSRSTGSPSTEQVKGLQEIIARRLPHLASSEQKCEPLLPHTALAFPPPKRVVRETDPEKKDTPGKGIKEVNIKDEQDQSQACNVKDERIIDFPTLVPPLQLDVRDSAVQCTGMDNLADPFIGQKDEDENLRRSHESALDHQEMEKQLSRIRGSLNNANHEKAFRETTRNTADREISHSQKAQPLDQAVVEVLDVIFSFSCIIATTLMVMGILVSFSMDGQRCGPYKLAIAEPTLDSFNQPISQPSQVNKPYDGDSFLQEFATADQGASSPTPQSSTPSIFEKEEFSATGIAGASARDSLKDNNQKPSTQSQLDPQYVVVQDNIVLDYVDHILGWRGT